MPLRATPASAVLLTVATGAVGGELLAWLANHPSRFLVRRVINVSLAHFKIRGLHIVESSEQELELVRKQSRLVRSVCQGKLDSMIAQFNPYTNHDIDFEMQAARHTLGRDFEEPCLLDPDCLGRLLDHAASAEWGRAGSAEAGLDHRHTMPKRRANDLHVSRLRFD